MSGDRWGRIEALYHEALGRAPEERGAFLEDACRDDAALKAELRSLLECGEASDEFLERPALEDEAKSLAGELGSLLGERDLGGYEILSLLGAGGMGEVYRARDRKLGREAAIKVLARADAGGSGALRRFEEEARLASALNHPNIVTIYGVGEKEDIAYIAMELVRGRTLRDLLRQGTLAPSESLRLASQLADALAAAHGEGIVHRDLKPENLMVSSEGLLKVLDFGIAKLHSSTEVSPSPGVVGERTGKTETGAILGTVGYMSPEQAAGLPAEPASDQFSFGAIFYEMLSGRRAFQRAAPGDTLDAILHDEPVSIGSLSPGLREVLTRCLAKAPGDRYADTRQLAARVRTIRDEDARPAAKPTRRIAIGLGVAAGIAAAAGFGYWKLQPEDSGIRSLAVLPFTSLSKPEDLSYLSDGLTRSLIRRISALASLSVKPFSAVADFQGKDIDPRAVGRKLSASAVVTGTVARESGRLQVSAELVDVATGARLWQNRYDRDGADALSILDEIAAAIVHDGIRLRISNEESRQLRSRPTDDPVAYDLYLRAIQRIEQATEADYLAARELLGQAIARDPNFALAYVSLATTYSVMAVDGYEKPADVMPQVSRNVRRALDCDQELPDAHSEAAVALFYFEWDWAGADREWNLALQSRGGGIVPDFLVAYAYQQWALGKPKEALALVRKARTLDPLSPALMIREADFLLNTGKLDEADGLYERVLRAAPAMKSADGGLLLSNAWLGLAEVRREEGRFDEAIDATRLASEATGDDTLEELFRTARGADGYAEIERRGARAQLEALEQRAAGGEYASPLDFARAFARLSDRERAFRHLDAALDERSPGLVFLGVDRAWSGLRDDPRFLAAVRRVGLPAPSLPNRAW